MNKNQLAWTLVVALAFANGALLAQNLSLRSRLEPPRGNALDVGERLRTFRAKTLKGTDASFSFDGTGVGPTIFLFFSPSCRFCDQQLPVWSELLALAAERGDRVVGLVRESEDPAEVARYLVQYGADNLDVALVPLDFVRDHKLLITPLAFTADARGNVLVSLQGLAEGSAREILATLSGRGN